MQSLTRSTPSQNDIIRIAREENPLIVPFLEAFSSKLIRSCSDQEILTTLLEIVSTSTFQNGNKSKEDEEVEGIIGALLPDCKLFWKTLTLDELKLAANRGVRGLYGDFIGVSVASLSKCFNSYMMDMARQEAKKALHEAQNVEEKVMISEEQLKINRTNIILNAFEKYKATGMYDDLGNYVYDSLKSAKIIQYTGKEVAEFIIQAIDNLKNKKAHFLMDCKDLAEGRKVKRELEALSKEEVEVTPEVKIEAKRIMLFARFDEMIFDEVDLKELLA